MIRIRAIAFLIISIVGIGWLCSQGTLLIAQTFRKQRKEEQALAMRAVRFEPKSALDGVTEDGFRFSSEIWEASDGTSVFLRREYCRSSKNAERALRQSVNGASRIFETKPLRNKKGTKVGRRMVVSFGSDMVKQPQMILWTDRDMLYIVESSSFIHALSFEKKLPNL